jgi:hypothetical protein
MFGVVPRTLWQTRFGPDERNRIPMAMRCLLVEHDAGLVLIDTVLGKASKARRSWKMRLPPRDFFRVMSPG